jgi:hypothetical protein
MMNAIEIADFIENEHPITYNSLEIKLNTGDIDVGIFVQHSDYSTLKEENIWRFVKNPNIGKWKETHDEGFTELINGNLIVNIKAL